MLILFAVFCDLLLAHVFLQSKASEELIIPVFIALFVNGMATAWACSGLA